MITEIDIANLPVPSIIEELNAETIIAQYKADFMSRYPTFDVSNLESDTAIKIFETCAYRETLMRARANDVARNDLIAYSTGTTLDHVAAFHDVVRLTNESDDRLRSRVILAIAGRSPGGTKERYEFIAMSADVRVRDAVAWVDNTSPIVRINITSTLNGGVPYPEMIEAVRLAVNADAVKLVNDTIIVAAATSQIVNITADVWLLPNTSVATFDGLPQLLRDAWDAETGLGFDLTPAWIGSRLMRPGIQKVIVTSPSVDVVAQFQQAIALGTVVLTNKGRAF